MEITKFYFIEKDFVGFPKGLFTAYYDEEGDLVTANSPHIPKTLSKVKSSKLSHFSSLEEILDYRMCKCAKRVCEVNEELYNIVNNKNKREESK